MIGRLLCAFCVLVVVGCTPTPTPPNALAAIGGRWVQLYHGEIDGAQQIRVPIELEEMYPDSDWALFNARCYFENTSGGLITVRIAGITLWVQRTEGPVSFHCDATRHDGVWWIDTETDGACFVDLWGIF